jgi:hypothetical protein
VFPEYIRGNHLSLNPSHAIQSRARKQRMLNQASDLLQIANDSLHSKVNARDYDDLGGMETAISTLNLERELLGKISTWPWDLKTIRGFMSAVLLPICARANNLLITAYARSSRQ